MKGVRYYLFFETNLSFFFMKLFQHVLNLSVNILCNASHIFLLNISCYLCICVGFWTEYYSSTNTLHVHPELYLSRPGDAYICVSKLSLSPIMALSELIYNWIKKFWFSFKKINVTILSVKWHPFCLSPNVLMKLNLYTTHFCETDEIISTIKIYYLMI